MIEIIPANRKPDYLLIEELADTIWREHYPSIISVAQIDYMLNKYNSIKSIENRAKEGVLFFYMTYTDIPVGYIAIEKEINCLYISKLYVLKEYRGKKIAKHAMLYANYMAFDFGLRSIKLHVNKYNTNSILAYEKMGFVNKESIVTDIGSGFVMDDYLMVKMI